MNIQEYAPQFEKTIEHLKTELNGLRTNRATPSLIENVKVVAYEGSDPMPLDQLASVSIPEPRQLLIEPWDQTTLQPIEKELQNNEIGFSVANEGTAIRLSMPLMTDEVRQQILKVLSGKLEEARVAIRGIRDKAKDEISKQEKEKAISEDDKYNLIEALDKMTKEFTETVKEVGVKKEEEIKS